MTTEERLEFYSAYDEFFYDVEVRDLPDGSVGVFATDDIPKDQTLIRIPASFTAYSWDYYEWTPIFGKTKPYVLQLVARIIYERIESTSDEFFTQYVKSMPHEIILFGDISEEQNKEFYDMMEMLQLPKYYSEPEAELYEQYKELIQDMITQGK